MMRRLPIGPRLHVMVVVMLAAIAIVAWSAVAEMRDRLLAERRDQCRMLVDVALNDLALLEAKVAAGMLPRAEAEREGIARISAMTVGGNYLWVNDTRPVMIWHPITELVGRAVGDTMFDAERHPLFPEMVRRTEGGVGAFVAYDWPRPGGGAASRKLSYVKRFEPWNWVVGSGIYIDDVEAGYREVAKRFGLIALAAGAIGGLVAWLLGRSVTRPLAAVTAAMERLAEDAPADVSTVAVDHADEIGALGRAMAAFQRSLDDRAEAHRQGSYLRREIEVVFQHMSEAVMVTDAENRITRVNPSFTRITGYTAEEALGKDPGMLASGRHDRAFYSEMWRELSRAGEWHGEIWNRNKGGEVYPESLSITVIPGDDGKPAGYLATFLDITDRKRRETRMRWRAEHDRLTGLFNRDQFEARLADAVRVAREGNGGFTLMFVDLDGFKPVNDEYGHSVGDAVLRQVGKRIRAQVRGDDTVSRLGGDEFTVLIAGLTSAEGAERIAEKVVLTLSQPFRIRERTVTIGASVGVALFPDHGDDGAKLVAAADEAMYVAKEAGRGRYAFAGDSMAHAVAWRDATM